MSANTLITQINRSDTFPYMVKVTTDKNSGYISIITNNWTPQMFYELPSIRFDIYVERNGEMSKYNQTSYTIDTYSSQIDTNVCSICLKNVPSEFYVYIYPIFDNDAIAARNELIKIGLETGNLWTSITDTFNIDISI